VAHLFAVSKITKLPHVQFEILSLHCVIEIFILRTKFSTWSSRKDAYTITHADTLKQRRELVIHMLPLKRMISYKGCDSITPSLKYFDTVACHC